MSVLTSYLTLGYISLTSFLSKKKNTQFPPHSHGPAGAFSGSVFFLGSAVFIEGACSEKHSPSKRNSGADSSAGGALPRSLGFSCHKPGHFARQCHNKKKGSKKSHMAALASTEVDEFATRFENEFARIACLSSSASSGVWYRDNGTSSHMTRVWEYFSSLQEEEMDIVIEMGNNAKCRAACHGIVTFQREFGKPLMVRDVLYVSGMTKNLISISSLEDRSYVVSFQDGQVYIEPKDSRITKVSGVRREKLYRLQFELARELVSSACDLAELWHKRMAHLHYGTLKVVLKEIMIGLPYFSTEHHEVCKGCTMGKYTKTGFSSSDSKTRGIPDLIHPDVCVPMSSPFLSGYDYYVTFIDNHSKKT
jgi:hypothetical protein